MRWLLPVFLLACGHGSGAPPAPGSGSVIVPAASVPAAPAPEVAEAPQPAELDCTQQPFETATPVHEASGAGWLTIDGKLAMVVVSDSGNDGEYGVVDPDTGVTLEVGKLPLGDAGDDIEGVAGKDGKLYGLTSAGWMRVWERRGAGFALVAGPYPLGPQDLPNGGGGNRPPKTDGMVCGAHHGNCGRNYEGLCLAARPAPGCVGFAAAKADGHLYCLVEADGKLAVSRDRPIEITKPGAMADCAFDDQDRLWVGNNLFGLSVVYRVDGWRHRETASVVSIGSLGGGFPEVVAGRGEMLYRMSDTGGAPSLMQKFRCSAKQR